MAILGRQENFSIINKIFYYLTFLIVKELFTRSFLKEKMKIKYKKRTMNRIIFISIIKEFIKHIEVEELQIHFFQLYFMYLIINKSYYYQSSNNINNY